MLSNVPPKYRGAVIPVAVLVGFAILLFYSSGTTKMPNGVPMITNNDQYNELLKEAQDFTQKSFEKQDAGEDLTQEERVNAMKAANDFQAMNIYRPSMVFSEFAEGRCYQAVQAWDLAEAKYRQAILNGKFDKSDSANLTVPEAHFRLSQVRFQAGDYENALEEASRAVRAQPNNPDYLACRASVLIQLRRYDEASKDLQQALTLDPAHAKSEQLQKLLDLERQRTNPTVGK